MKFEKCDAMGKLICTESGNPYLYITETNEILNVDKAWLEALPENNREEIVLQAASQNGLISGIFPEKYTWPLSFEQYQEAANNNLRGITLELTQECTLRCDYCIYSGNYGDAAFRTHQNIYMSKETIKKSIDYFAEHNRLNPDGHISLYGGEPLIHFDLVKYAVEYARIRCGTKPISFSISTNGTTLRSDILSWIDANDEISLTITVNGSYHDLYRKFPSGEGSLNVIMSNLKKIRKDYPRVWGRTRLIANVASDREFLELRKFYIEEIGKPPTLVTGIQKFGGNDIIKKITSEYDDQKSEKLMYRKQLTNLLAADYDEYITPYFGINLEAILQRRIKPLEQIEYCGYFCRPFSDTLFVSADGTFGICEKDGAKQKYGNVNTGVNWKEIQNLMFSIQKAKEKQCTHCWAQRICDACFQCVLEDTLGQSYIPEDICQQIRRNCELDLKLICELAERNPVLLNQIMDKLESEVTRPKCAE